MARSLRIERSGGVYHVINRGNYRQDLFINDGPEKGEKKESVQFSMFLSLPQVRLA